MELISDVGRVASRFSPFGDSVSVRILMQDRCTVCTERTIGHKIVLDAPDETRK
jgi:hypothetical protein